jgi:hypothetical protein
VAETFAPFSFDFSSHAGMYVLYVLYVCLRYIHALCFSLASRG